MKVLKFGGACLASPTLLHRVAAVVREEREEKVVVVSAVAGVTDRLIAFLERPHPEAEIDGFIAEVRGLHLGLLPREGLDTAVAEAAIDDRLRKLERLLYGVSYTEEVTPRTRDLVLSFGERLSAAVLVARLRPQGVPAEAVEAEAAGIVTDGCHGNASALLKECADRIPRALGPRLQAGVTPVVTGFYGVSPEGHVTLLGRGGSDYSATVLGYALGARMVEIWKEVDGFMTADPEMVPWAAPIAKLSYDEATELAYFGARVLHPRAVQPARPTGMRILIRSLRNPREAGTEIGPDGVEHSEVIKSVSYRRDLVTLKLHGADAGYKPGALGEITGRLGAEGVNVYSATTSQTCIALLIGRDDVPRAQRALQPLLDDGGTMEGLEVLPSTALICTVGEGLGYRKGVAARIFRATAEAGINVQLISAGASTVALHFTVDAADLERAVRAIHDEFFGGRA